VVVQFPYKLPDSAIIASQVTALDQLNFVKKLQTEWSDNSVSCCLVGNSLIQTSKGFMYLADICKKGVPMPANFSQVSARLVQDEKKSSGFYIHTKSVVTSTGELYASNAYYINGVAPTVKLMLGNGATLEGTGKHKVQVIDETSKVIAWKPLADLCLGDYVVARVGLERWPERKQYVLENIVVRQDYWASVFAINLLPDFHYISCSAETFYQRCQGWLSYWGDLDFHTLPSLLETKWGSLYRGIPRFVLQGSREVVLQYLSFLWYLTYELFKDKAEFVVVAAFRTALVLQTLLNNLGIVANIVPSSVVEDRYNLAVYGKDSILFMLSLLARRLSPFETNVYRELRSVDPDPGEFETDGPVKAPLVGQVPAMDFRAHFQEHLMPNLQSKEFCKKMEAVCEHHDPSLDRQTLAQFSDLGLNVPDVFLDVTYLFHKIKNIIFNDTPQKTYDISVPVVNNYLVQSGIVSHNTVYYRREELGEIQQWLRSNYENNVKTCSFLLHSEHGFDQAPLEEITEEKYKEMLATCRPFDGFVTGTTGSPTGSPTGPPSSLCLESKLVQEGEDDDLLEVECPGGACPVR
jgi:hypothetical protein